ncbi:hypothetical protein CDAR_523341, partial [Caerostris darwini]
IVVNTRRHDLTRCMRELEFLLTKPTGKMMLPSRRKIKMPDGYPNHVQVYEIRGYYHRCLADRVSFEEKE